MMLQIGDVTDKIALERNRWREHRKQQLERKISKFCLQQQQLQDNQGRMSCGESQTSKQLCLLCRLPVTLCSNELNEPDSSLSCLARLEPPALLGSGKATPQFSCPCNQISPAYRECSKRVICCQNNKQEVQEKNFSKSR